MTLEKSNHVGPALWASLLAVITCLLLSSCSDDPYDIMVEFRHVEPRCTHIEMVRSGDDNTYFAVIEGRFFIFTKILVLNDRNDGRVANVTGKELMCIPEAMRFSGKNITDIVVVLEEYR